MKKITVLIPCYNEEKGVQKVIRGIPVEKLRRLGFKTEVVVIDNNSTDKTSSVAKKLGATVLFEPKKGKGNAMKLGFSYINLDTDYIIMLDGDDTYKGYEIPRLVEPLDSGFCDVVVGSRLLGKINKGAFKFSNRIVNWGYAFMVRHFYRANVTDVLSGFFAWRKEALDDLKIHLNSDGFAIEMEMITKMVKMGHSVYSVPITYDVREGESKISSFADGFRISKMFLRNFTWKPTQPEKQKIEIDIEQAI
ncbi:MAG TPA: glycosyltransferase family 2 protein [Patescibacteria group bacterium]|nr:glycosyltransferase family 2 protein [Patescibacteria group bacterium]